MQILDLPEHRERSRWDGERGLWIISDGSGRTFATRERAMSIVAGMGLREGDRVLIRFGLETICAPGFVQGLLASLSNQRVLVEAATCPPHTRGMVERVASRFGQAVGFL
jgi:hypothetical protein